MIHLKFIVEKILYDMTSITKTPINGVNNMKTLAQSIEMISWTEKDGKIHPIKFKITDESEKTQIIKIIRIQKSEWQKIAGNRMVTFTCEIILNHQLRLCELHYEVDSCKWILFKM